MPTVGLETIFAIMQSKEIASFVGIENVLV
jgi:hypothetical protein